MDGAFVGELGGSVEAGADSSPTPSRSRKGVKFHDGKDMTVDDVVYPIDEIWKKYAAASRSTDLPASRAPDGDTVVVKFSKPVPEFFCSLLTAATSTTSCPSTSMLAPTRSPIPANNAPIATGPVEVQGMGCAAATSSMSANDPTGAPGHALHGSRRDSIGSSDIAPDGDIRVAMPKGIRNGGDGSTSVEPNMRKHQSSG